MIIDLFYFTDNFLYLIMRQRVMANGELLAIDDINEMVKKFEEFNWIEQQSFLLLIKNKRMKKPPNNHWSKKIMLKEKFNTVGEAKP